MFSSNIHPSVIALAMGATDECCQAVQGQIGALVPICYSNLAHEILNNPPAPCDVYQAAACFRNLMWQAANDQGPYRFQDGPDCRLVIAAPAAAPAVAA